MRLKIKGKLMFTLVYFACTLQTMLVYACVSFEAASYQEVALPVSAQALGWVLVALCLVPIPFYAVYSFTMTQGPVREVSQLFLSFFKTFQV